MAAKPQGELPAEPWRSFLADLDAFLVQPTDLHCIGGFGADGLLDRLVHNAHRIEMRGDSMRRNRGKPNA